MNKFNLVFELFIASHSCVCLCQSSLFGVHTSLNELVVAFRDLTYRFVSRDVFQGLNELESLDLEHNLLNYLDSEAFGPLEQLKHAQLSHNLLSFINEEGYPQGGLSYTDIIGNQSPFRHCTKLEYLYLANNSIGDIFDDWRINLLKIRTLDLSYNKIQRLVVSILF